MKQLFGITCALALFTVMATAQTSSTTTTTSAGGTTESTTTTTEASGTISEFTPGSQIVLSTGGSPTTYRFSKTVTYVTPSGKVIEASKVKKNSKVKVHYLKEGNDMMVDKVIVDDVD